MIGRKGFTLVEVVISIFIVGILSTVTVIGFQSARQDDNLRLATLRLADTLRSAQNYAQSGILTLYDEKDKTYKTFGSASGYGVYLEKGTSPKVFLFVDTRNEAATPPEDNTWSPSSDAITATLSLDIDGHGSIEINSISLAGTEVQDADIVFKRPIAAVFIDGSQEASKKSATITLRNTINNHTKTIFIDRITGRIDAEY